MIELCSTRHVIRGAWDCAGSNSMCVSRSDFSRDVGGRSTRIRNLELDGEEENHAIGQETLPLVLWIYIMHEGKMFLILHSV